MFPPVRTGRVSLYSINKLHHQCWGYYWSSESFIWWSDKAQTCLWGPSDEHHCFQAIFSRQKKNCMTAGLMPALKSSSQSSPWLIVLESFSLWIANHGKADIQFHALEALVMNIFILLSSLFLTSYSFFIGLLIYFCIFQQYGTVMFHKCELQKKKCVDKSQWSNQRILAYTKCVKVQTLKTTMIKKWSLRNSKHV